MKRILLFALVLLMVKDAATQATKHKAVKKTEQKSTAAKSAAKKAATAKKQPQETINLSSTANYPAKATGNSIFNVPATTNNYMVSDPFVNTLNARARGIEPDIKNVEIFGMPKAAYGFANGRIRLFPTGTTSSGTITGSSGVALGSSTGTMGSTGTVFGVNGKSPYAGTAMWGNARGLIITRDSTMRQ